MELPEKIYRIKSYLVDHEFPEEIEAAVILGSGLGDFSTTIDEPFSIPYNQIPDFPHTSVAGHSGELFTGSVKGHKIIAFSGRFHHYEGHPLSTTVLPVHLAKAFNAKKLIVSNAAGAINTNFKVGDLMVIDDIFRVFQKVAPVPDQPHRYNLGPITDQVRMIAASIGLEVQRGTYLFAKGPSYESKAEIRAFRIMGADVVGMSTAPELIEASRLELPAAAISLVTNMAAGVLNQKLDHSEVKVAAESRKEDFAKLVNALIQEL